MNYLDPPGQNRVFVFFWAGLSSRGGVLLCLFFPAGAYPFFLAEEHFVKSALNNQNPSVWLGHFYLISGMIYLVFQTQIFPLDQLIFHMRVFAPGIYHQTCFETRSYFLEALHHQ